MSKETYIGGDLIEEIGGSYKIYAQEGYEISSGKEIIFNAKNGIFYGEPKEPIITAEVIEVGFAKQETKESTLDTTKKVMSLPVKESFAMGEKVFLKVKTLGLIGKKLKVEVRQAIEKQLADKDQKIGTLSVLEMTVGKITQNEDAKNKYDTSNLRALENIALKEMTLEPKMEEEKKNWKDILAKSKDKKIKLYFHVEVLDAEGEVIYKGDDKNDSKNFSTQKPFELFEGGKCFCNSDLTVEEVKNIVKQLRDSDSYVKKKFGYDLFSKSDCNIPSNEKTYEKFTEELNKCFNKYEINTCIRRIHFLAQSYTESAFFTTTIEGGGLKYLKSKKYYPFIGRGIIQLTHSGEAVGEAGYKQYFEYLGRTDYKTNSDLLNKNIHYAVDASGYFWFRGKLLSKGDVLKSKYPNAKGEYKSFPRKKVLGFYTVDINLVADDDNVKEVTLLVNGGQTAIDERTEFTKKLKEVFKYDSCKNKK